MPFIYLTIKLLLKNPNLFHRYIKSVGLKNAVANRFVIANKLFTPHNAELLTHSYCLTVLAHSAFVYGNKTALRVLLLVG
jgi:hypothetical protein